MSLARHFMTLFSGRLIAQIILIISTPILTRLFAPEHFGLITLVSSITQVPMILLMGRDDKISDHYNHDLIIIIDQK